ncbi:MAG: DUF4136 domain-containing protein [Cyclobacteriaceae bacterium]|nr:DUF4136 domain-containing protein [Cyclobacteriaceae bacterium SS2]
MVKHLFILFVFITALSSCNVYRDVAVFRDKEADFQRYKTYAWLPEVKHSGDSVCTDDFIRKDIRRYIAHCLVQRNMNQDTVEAQLLIHIEWLSHAREMKIPPDYDIPELFDIGYYYAPAIYFRDGKLTGKPGWRNGYSSTDKIRYIHGGVKLTAVDSETNELVWEGVAQGDLYDHKEMYEDLHPVIHKMMKKFPIKITGKDGVKH